jgi:hypothetical protein
VDCDLLQAVQLDVIFNFARYEELKEAVQQLVRDNLDPDLLRDEAHDLFESWWSSDNSKGEWNEAVKERTWTSLWNEFGDKNVQR